MKKTKYEGGIAEISLTAAARNYQLVKKCAARPVCCVVKANAYGHGACVLGTLFEKLGAEMLAVANPEEGFTLRRCGIQVPILILGYTSPALLPEVLEHRLTVTVYSLEEGRRLSAAMRGTRRFLPAHLKLDTGMGRLGFSFPREEDALKEVVRLPRIAYTGIYTHLASADTGKQGVAKTTGQLLAFHRGVEVAETVAGRLLRHASNSGGILDYPEAGLDMVRAGILLYGYLPGEVIHPLPVTPCLTVKAPLIAVREVPSGIPLGYGGAYVTTRPTRVGVIPLGYADGIPRAAGERGCKVGCRRGYAPIIGRVCMDATLVDLTDTGGAPEEVVTLFGPDPETSASAYAHALSTIPYELLTGIGPRVKRVYL